MISTATFTSKNRISIIVLATFTRSPISSSRIIRIMKADVASTLI